MSLVASTTMGRRTARGPFELAGLAAAGSTRSSFSAAARGTVGERLRTMAAQTTAVARRWFAYSGAAAWASVAMAQPSTRLGHMLEVLASDPDTACDYEAILARLRPMVDAAVHHLEDRQAALTADDDLPAAGARLADDAVIGLLRLIRRSTGGQWPAAAFSVVALGRYGQYRLMPGAPIELLSLVPDRSRQRTVAEDLALQLEDGLCRLGFSVANSISTPQECVAFALDEPRVLASIRDARYLAGAYGPWEQLQTQLEAAHWGAARPGHRR